MTGLIATGTPTQLAGVLEGRLDDLIDLWQRLGQHGPAFASPASIEAEQLRETYLRPLARTLVGALRGSGTHRAVYLDERLRFVDPALSPSARAGMLAATLEQEADELASLLEGDVAPGALRDALRSVHADLTELVGNTTPVLFIGDCLFTETRAFLTPLAHRRGQALDVRHIYFSAGQQVDASVTAIVDEVRRTGPSLIGLSLFTFDGVPPWSAAWAEAARPFGGRRALGFVDGLTTLLEETVRGIRVVSDSPIVIHAPAGLPLDRVRRRVPAMRTHSRPQRRLLDVLGRRVAELVAGSENTILLDEREIVRTAGGLRSLGRPVFPRDDVPPGMFHTSRLGAALATFYDDVCADLDTLGRAKAVFVDFDNTLWRGVMGDGDVVHDVAGQRLLRTLKEAGVLLIALSKNDPANIRWDEMALDPDDFVLHKVNWLPKPDNVSAAIHELDLAPEAFVLLDDNPVERALVTEQIPGVGALDPTTPQAWRALHRWLEFPSTKPTEEARRRTAMYREAAERRAAMSQTHDYAAMMRSLQLRYSLREARPSDATRLIELIQRTNQFNTTTRRRSRAEIESLIDDDRYAVHVASLKDRFGDLGVVAAVVFETGTRTFDSFIMSCRAMGFGLELAVLHDVMAAHGSGQFVGLFVPSDRNTPAADLFARAGFEQRTEHEWVLDAEHDGWPSVPDWLIEE